MSQKKRPVRTCVGCRTSDEKERLLRVVRSAEGEITIDPTGKKPGRGAPQEITVFDTTGLIIQDLALGLAVYQQAKERGLGEEKDFLR